ncbi:MAG: response regulator transcription factor [Alphaproteobacteria bacterium]|jgi:DNA-binding NarL/FixJ family response regulator|nr:response regulator transcription factor [Alphaproteobacteria bacterium]MBU2040579.1 response regulator transcription factor [Alphaproteobacteria bacterium]MBU2125232.1 response regulator transcription factor [Alphaproteobacteria bacterium]MBU2209976.1 response regulator transcription factor [Alphaproteobacteria bacterium]MBU2290670.1 response regulator transcription factor [Alphaproteobacteria bacterium]
MHQTNASALRVAIVDDEPIARSRLRRLLGGINSPPSTILMECGSADAILAQGPRLPLDAVFIDIEMPGRSGLAALERWRGRRPEFVLVTAHHEHALKAFDLQAADYLTKPVSEKRLHQTLTRLWSRCRATEAGTTGDALASMDLTERQVQILGLLGEGLANKEIARILGLSHFTVRNHLMALFRRYGVSRRVDLCHVARPDRAGSNRSAQTFSSAETGPAAA